jgi:carbon-monoxide dehydrogenase large subunit/6-hydroxypseudooxynicotine dehydrogenase subunit gamma
LVITGGASLGQGFETAIAQVCAERLGVDYRRVRVVRGRTDRIEYGVGAHATRATVMTANATAIAADNVRAKALDMAAQLLQVEAAVLTIVKGRVIRTDGTGASIGLGDLAHHLRPSSSTRGNRDPGLAADGWFTTAHMTYPYGVQIAVVRIDPGTGGVQIEKMLIAFDVGRAINPVLVQASLLAAAPKDWPGPCSRNFSTTIMVSRYQ